MIEKFVTAPFMENTYLVSEGTDAFLVDPGMGLESHLDEINKYNIIGILLTHAHIDHIEGIKYFGCPIYISKEDSVKLNDEVDNVAAIFHIKAPSFDLSNLKVIDDNDIIKLIGTEIKVYKTPGHTNGSVVYQYKDVLFTGDTLFQVGIGRTDFPTGDMKKMVESLKFLKTLEDFKIYPGHGEESTISFEKQYNPYLK